MRYSILERYSPPRTPYDQIMSRVYDPNTDKTGALAPWSWTNMQRTDFDQAMKQKWQGNCQPTYLSNEWKYARMPKYQDKFMPESNQFMNMNTNVKEGYCSSCGPNPAVMYTGVSSWNNKY
jgi:hypothetical protein